MGNYIGTDVSGLNRLNNIGDGVDVTGADDNTIGGTAADDMNVISGNLGSGIDLSADADDNQVLGNFIGTNKTGISPLSNQVDGVDLTGVIQNTIGGTMAGSGNLISGNADSGISLNAGANDNLILGNMIGTDASGEKPVGDNVGITIDTSSDNVVGGTATGDANVISGNTSIGIQISNSLATGNTVLGNLIGIDKDGTQVVLKPTPDLLPVGILINDSPGNQIGGTAARRE